MEHKKCSVAGKIRFATPGDAKESLEKLKGTGRFFNWLSNKRVNRRQKKISQCRYYYCKDCNGFHLTSSVTPYTKGSLKDIKTDWKKKSKGLIVRPNEVEDWKADSLPFPKID